MGTKITTREGKKIDEGRGEQNSTEIVIEGLSHHHQEAGTVALSSLVWNDASDEGRWGEEIGSICRT